MSGRRDRARELAAHPRWDAIEQRLRLRMSPKAVLAALATQFPGEPWPQERTLRRFVRAQPASWFIAKTVVEALTATPAHRTSLDRHEAFLDTLELRARRGIEGEQLLGLPVLVDAVTRATEQYTRAIERHVGLEQKVAAANGGKLMDSSVPVDEQAAAMRVAATILEMPPDQMMQVLRQMFPAPAGTDLLEACPLPDCHHDEHGFRKPPPKPVTGTVERIDAQRPDPPRPA